MIISHIIDMRLQIVKKTSSKKNRKNIFCLQIFHDPYEDEDPPFLNLFCHFCGLPLQTTKFLKGLGNCFLMLARLAQGHNTASVGIEPQTFDLKYLALTTWLPHSPNFVMGIVPGL